MPRWRPLPISGINLQLNPQVTVTQIVYEKIKYLGEYKLFGKYSRTLKFGNDG